MFDEQLPQAITLDLNTHSISCLQTLRALRHPDRSGLIQLVLLSASSSEKPIMERYRHGARSFVKKPAAHDSFREAIKAILDYWIHLNYMPAPCRGSVEPKVYRA
jgi:DNA-binding response OmpR family regulator